MKLKSWSPVIAGLLVSLTAASAFSQSPPTPEGTVVNVVCEAQNSTPTTVAKTTVEDRIEDIPVFHWRASALPSYMDPQQLCEDVSAKLKSAYEEYGNELSFSTDEIRNSPVVFVEKPGERRQELFSLPSTSDLNKILDSRWDKFSDQRGDHKRTSGVNFWTLLFQ